MAGRKKRKMRMRVEQFCILLPTSHFELLPSPDCAVTGHQAQDMCHPPALVGRWMLFIQFGAGRRGGEISLTLMPAAWMAIKAGLQGTWGYSANLPSSRLATLTHLLPLLLPACHLNKQCFYRALGKASLSNSPALEGWLLKQCLELRGLLLTPSRPSERQ